MRLLNRHRHGWRALHRWGASFNSHRHQWTTIVDQVCTCGQNRRVVLPSTPDEIMAVINIRREPASE